MQMSFLNRLFLGSPPPYAELWSWITSTARQPRWYLDLGVADSVDGRFDMVALVTSLVMLEMEQRGLLAETARLTEHFVDDMDGSLRALGISDMVMSKHMGRVVGALGGRVGAYRNALASDAPATLLNDTLIRNIYREDNVPEAAVVDALAASVRELAGRIAAVPNEALLAGEVG